MDFDSRGNLGARITKTGFCVEKIKAQGLQSTLTASLQRGKTP